MGTSTVREEVAREEEDGRKRTEHRKSSMKAW